MKNIYPCLQKDYLPSKYYVFQENAPEAAVVGGPFAQGSRKKSFIKRGWGKGPAIKGFFFYLK